LTSRSVWMKHLYSGLKMTAAGAHTVIASLSAIAVPFHACMP